MPPRDIVDEGVDAYCLGLLRPWCPYDEGTQAHRDWLRGWDQAEEIDIEDKVVHLENIRKG
ncbi:Rmf/CrpP family protein [Mesorhizobium sp. IMUNJ 23232]|uniref:Rmf/CrpP family protein n=1 Tax=Mesorhizobium sp. IMUNJ 23232 TaxID=3376064 RepID=UPI0037AFD558